MRPVRVLAAASEEAAAAAAWYERERRGLGVEFRTEVERALAILAGDLPPLTSVPGVARARGVKRLFLRRFPYAVVVRERATEVLVIAFAHFSRRPGYWRGRLPG